MKLLMILFLFLLLLFPGQSLEGARNGLLLWFHTVLPTLFPFLFLSNLLLSTGMAHTISRFLQPVFSPVFRVSIDGCYGVLIGLIAGYPLGAKTCADLVSTGHISRKEGQYLLSFCNNASPMFLISVVGTSLLGLPYHRCLLLWSIQLVSSCLAGRICRRFVPSDEYSVMEANQQSQPMVDQSFSHMEASLETAIRTITLVGGYIILSGILGHILTTLPGPVPALKSFLAGVLEITTGCNALASLPLPEDPKNVLICTITAFGGLSGILQTTSVMGNSGLSVSFYVRGKILTALLAAILSTLLASVNIF